MARSMAMSLWAACCLSCFGGMARAASPNSYDLAHPFRSVAGWLIENDGDGDGGAAAGAGTSVGSSEAAVKRALLMLSKTQLMTKGVDGAAFKLSSATGRGSASRSNITAELDKLRGLFAQPPAVEAEAEGAGAGGGGSGVVRPAVAAAKVVHKAMAAQEGLRCAELVELAANAHGRLLDDLGGRDADDTGGSSSVLGAGSEWAAAAEAAGVLLLAPPIRVPLPVDRGGGPAAEVCALLLWDKRAAAEAASWALAGADGRVGGAVLTVVLCDSLQGACLVAALAAEPATAQCRAEKPPAAGAPTPLAPPRPSPSAKPAAAKPADAAAASGAGAHTSFSATAPPAAFVAVPVARAVMEAAVAVRAALAREIAAAAGAAQSENEGAGEAGVAGEAAVFLKRWLASAGSGGQRAVAEAAAAAAAVSAPSVSSSLRVVGHSFAGSVAALTAALLDGTLVATAATTDHGTEATEEDGDGDGDKEKEGGAAPSALLVPATSLALGPCPCIGGAATLPACTSVVLGDDLFARLQPRSLGRLRERVRRFLPGGRSSGGSESAGGSGGSAGATVSMAARLGSAWVGDAVGSTVRNLRHRSELDAKRKKKKTAAKAAGDTAAAAAAATAATIATEEAEEAAAVVAAAATLLLCPGVVYLVKPRASGEMVVTTTKKGGFSEALLWQMHDVLLSQSMLAHHDLGAYIHALDQI